MILKSCGIGQTARLSYSMKANFKEGHSIIEQSDASDHGVGNGPTRLWIMRPIEGKEIMIMEILNAPNKQEKW